MRVLERCLMVSQFASQYVLDVEDGISPLVLGFMMRLKMKLRLLLLANLDVEILLGCSIPPAWFLQAQ